MRRIRVDLDVQKVAGSFRTRVEILAAVQEVLETFFVGDSEYEVTHIELIEEEDAAHPG